MSGVLRDFGSGGRLTVRLETCDRGPGCPCGGGPFAVFTVGDSSVYLMGDEVGALGRLLIEAAARAMVAAKQGGE